jgi:hypothetical protein
MTSLVDQPTKFGPSPNNGRPTIAGQRGQCRMSDPVCSSELNGLLAVLGWVVWGNDMDISSKERTRSDILLCCARTSTTALTHARRCFGRKVVRPPSYVVWATPTHSSSPWAVGHEIRPGCLKVVAYTDSKVLADALAKQLSDD